jgi:hypothetical protein
VALQGDAYLERLARQQFAEGDRLRRLGFGEQAALYTAQGRFYRGMETHLTAAEQPTEYKFKDALEKADVFTNILQALEDINSGIAKLSFKGQ